MNEFNSILSKLPMWASIAIAIRCIDRVSHPEYSLDFKSFDRTIEDRGITRDYAVKVLTEVPRVVQAVVIKEAWPDARELDIHCVHAAEVASAVWGQAYLDATGGGDRVSARTADIAKAISCLADAAHAASAVIFSSNSIIGPMCLEEDPITAADTRDEDEDMETAVRSHYTDEQDENFPPHIQEMLDQRAQYDREATDRENERGCLEFLSMIDSYQQSVSEVVSKVASKTEYKEAAASDRAWLIQRLGAVTTLERHDSDWDPVKQAHRISGSLAFFAGVPSEFFDRPLWPNGEPTWA